MPPYQSLGGAQLMSKDVWTPRALNKLIGSSILHKGVYGWKGGVIPGHMMGGMPAMEKSNQSPIVPYPELQSRVCMFVVVAVVMRTREDQRTRGPEDQGFHLPQSMKGLPCC
jgi:hypothetical protein